MSFIGNNSDKGFFCIFSRFFFAKCPSEMQFQEVGQPLTPKMLKWLQ